MISADQETTPPQIATFVDTKGHIYLLAHDSHFLNEKAKILIEYTRVTYPSTQTTLVSAQAFDINTFEDDYKDPPPLDKDQSKLEYDAWKQIDGLQTHMFRYLNREYIKTFQNIKKGNFTHSLCLNSLLPSYVKMMIDISQRCPNNFDAINCFGTVGPASGIYPLMTIYNSFDGLHIDSLDTKEVKEPTVGDIILIGDKHAFVFIDHDICLSANGRFSPFEIYQTEFVLKKYNAPNQEMRIFRKTNATQYPQSLLDAFAEMYYLRVHFSVMANENFGVKRGEELIKNIYKELYLTKHTDYKFKDQLYKAYTGSSVGMYSIICEIEELQKKSKPKSMWAAFFTINPAYHQFAKECAESILDKMNGL